MKIDQILVVGGGIGGLSAALGLQRRGFTVRVFERAAEFREIGAGLVVSANARRALQDLGIDEDLEAASSCARVQRTCDYRTGEILGAVENSTITARYGLATLQVHRADLHAQLAAAVTRNDPNSLCAGFEMMALSQDEHGVSVDFRNGVTARGDVLIGADGNASVVRSMVFGGEEARFNGQVAFRALIPMRSVPEALSNLEFAMFRGPRRYLMQYPLRGGEVMNLIGCGQSPNWEAEGWSIAASVEEFEAAYADYWPEALRLIRAIAPGALYKWGLRDREPLENWVRGRVAMLGDAAHPMTPFLGQGACMAIEDALLLARAFAASSDLEEGLSRYEAARKPRGNAVQLWSREEGQALQDPRLPRKSAMDRGLFDYDPVSAAV